MNYEQLADEFLIVLAQIIRNPIHKESEVTSRGEFGILGHLAFIRDGVTPGELKDLFCVGSGRIADILKSLSRKEWIERRSIESDKRKALVFLTEKGRNAVMHKRDSIRKNHTELMKYLGEKDAEELVHLMKRIVSYQEHAV